MTVSPPPTDTDRLAEALRHLLSSDDATMYYDAPHAVWNAAERYAAALAPVVSQIAARRAAEELEAAAFNLDSFADEQSGWCGPIHDFADGLRARAAALVAAHPDHTTREDRP